jgi:hypothetical protein
MLTWLRHWRDRRDSARAAVVTARQQERDAEAAELAALRKRAHDQRAALHVLEWQADVKGRRTGRTEPS